MNHFDKLYVDCIACHRCELRQNCKQVVVGCGPKASKLCIVGEAPGADEDIVGEPFVGRCGEHLTNLLLKAGIHRDRIYITNVVKCRPPSNRLPTEHEIQTCKTWLWQELQAMPNLTKIITLGRISSSLLLQRKRNIVMKNIVGQPNKLSYLPSVLCYSWYHPSYLLRVGNKYDNDTIKFFEQFKGDA